MRSKNATLQIPSIFSFKLHHFKSIFPIYYCLEIVFLCALDIRRQFRRPYQRPDSFASLHATHLNNFTPIDTHAAGQVQEMTLLHSATSHALPQQALKKYHEAAKITGFYHCAFLEPYIAHTRYPKQRAVPQQYTCVSFSKKPHHNKLKTLLPISQFAVKKSLSLKTLFP